MKAQEIRIGNWIIYGQHIVQVKGINSNGLVQTRPTLDGYISDYNPIPLTPEILEKIIRPKSDKPITAAFIFPDVCMIATSEDGNILLGFNLLDRLVFVCKYVHQLQNAHFAMTGEELEINLP